MNDLKLPNIFITSLSEEKLFNPTIIGWDGLVLFKYLVRECWRSGKIALTDSEIEEMFSIAEKRRAKLKKLLRDHGIVRISTGGQKHNVTTYEVLFDSLATNHDTLRTVYRHGQGGLTKEKLDALAAEFAKMGEMQQTLLAQHSQEIPVSELWAIVKQMNESLAKYAKTLFAKDDKTWEAEPFKLSNDPKTLRRLRGALRHHNPKNLLAAFDKYAEYMTYKRYGIEQVEWLKAKEVPTNIFNYFTAFNKKKPYDIIQRCIAQNNIRTFDKKQ